MCLSIHLLVSNRHISLSTISRTKMDGSLFYRGRLFQPLLSIRFLAENTSRLKIRLITPWVLNVD